MHPHIPVSFLLTLLLHLQPGSAIAPLLISKRDYERVSAPETVTTAPSFFSYIGRSISKLFRRKPDPPEFVQPPAVRPTPVTLDTLTICTWNIFRFGPNKFSVPDPLIVAGKNVTRLDIIVDQLRDCHLAVIQELDDKTGSVAERLRMELQKRTGNPFSAIVSPRLGIRNLEQYLFLYRDDLLTAGVSAVFPDAPDPAQRLFHRQPYFTNFTAKAQGKQLRLLRGALRSFVIGTVHTVPTRAVEEISSLVAAFDWAAQTYRTSNVMILGDYNGDCQYVRARDWPRIPLWTQARFAWLVPTGTDTTSMTTHCTYDRAVNIGNVFNSTLVPGSVEAPNFPQKFSLTPAQAKLVSDHRLVRLQFQ
ncbi:deoxyribonuclease-1-like isoform X2 [Paramacrobiotus metropolitanus]|nr:deoxyribonuclease-1-like isoform X2 [Paramacrobiotus metropolitanus]